MNYKQPSDDLERSLASALARRPAPPDLAARIEARVASIAPARRRPLWPLALAASVVLAITGWQLAERRQGELAREQALQALGITAEKLVLVERKLGL